MTARPETTDSLFAYGTLMCEDIMQAVSGLHAKAVPATLSDYVCLQVRGQDYPGVVPRPGQVVHGKLYLDLTPSAWARLDAFEGEIYSRNHGEIERDDGSRAHAFVYVVLPEFANTLDETSWDYAAFQREGKQRFMARHRDFFPHG